MKPLGGADQSLLSAACARPRDIAGSSSQRREGPSIFRIMGSLLRFPAVVGSSFQHCPSRKDIEVEVAPQRHEQLASQSDDSDPSLARPAVPEPPPIP